MNIEEELAVLLRSRAEQVHTPPAPVDQLVASGEVSLRRRRNHLSLFAVAVVVVAVALAIGVPRLAGSTDRTTPPVDHPSPAPTPTSLRDMPRGAPPAIPYWSAGVLHVVDREFRMPMPDLRSGGNMVLLSTRAGDLHWSQVVGRKLVPRPALTGADVVVSTDGSLVVTSERLSHDLVRIVAWDSDTWHQVAHRAIQAIRQPSTGADPEVLVLGADSRGNVYYRSPGGTFAWRPTSNTVNRLIPGHHSWNSIAQVAAPGLVVQSGGGAGSWSGTIGAIGMRGRFTAIGTLPDGQGGRVSLDGSSIAYTTDANGEVGKAPRADAWVESLDHARKVRMQLPRDALPVVIGFETNSKILLKVSGRSDRRAYLVRCDTASGSCERAADLGNNGNWTVGR